MVQREKEPCKNKTRDEILHSTSVKGNDNYYKKTLYYIKGDEFFKRLKAGRSCKVRKIRRMSLWCRLTGKAEHTEDHTANTQYSPFIFGCCVCVSFF